MPPGTGDPCVEREPDHPVGARRADALVRIFERWLAPAGTARPELVVHVDADTIRSPDASGRCHIGDGPAIAVEAARRVGCDASVPPPAAASASTLDHTIVVMAGNLANAAARRREQNQPP